MSLNTKTLLSTSCELAYEPQNFFWSNVENSGVAGNRFPFVHTSAYDLITCMGSGLSSSEI